MIADGAIVTLQNGTIQTSFAERARFNYLIVNNGALTTQNITLRGDNLYAEGTTATIVNNNTLKLEAGTVVAIRVSGLIADSAIATTKDASVVLAAPNGCNWKDNTTLQAHVHTYENGYCACGEKNPKAKFLAKVTDQKGNLVKEYLTLAEAARNAADGQIVVLKERSTGAALEINADITVDFGGNVYTVNTNVDGAAIVIGKDAAITLQNGTIQIRFTYRKDFNCLVNNQGTLLVESTVTLNAANAQAEGAVAIKGNEPVYS